MSEQVSEQGENTYLRGNISYTKSSTTRRDNPVNLSAMRPFEDLVFDRICFIWHNGVSTLDDLAPVAGDQVLNGRPGPVSSRIEMRGVADCDRESNAIVQE